jgi:hypothetical protein
MKAMLLSSVCAVLLFGCSGDDDDSGDSGGSGSGARSGGGDSDGGSAGGGSGESGSGSGESGSGSGESGSGSGESGSGAGTDGGTGDFNVLELCGGPCACADGEDNDDDGVSDGFDTECTGPADNDEGTFATGISGDNMDPKWQDCFFDGNSGAGDDGCRYHTDCLTGDKEASDPSCTVTQGCLDFCSARTPNGCDCFGCCTIRTADGEELSIVISEQCREENPEDCTTCTPSTQCGNECGECELCPGKTVADLPEHCGDTPPPDGGTAGTGGSSGTGGSDAGTPGYSCDDGATHCAEQSDCPSTAYYCSFGCCQLLSPD